MLAMPVRNALAYPVYTLTNVVRKRITPQKIPPARANRLVSHCICMTPLSFRNSFLRERLSMSIARMGG